MCSTHAACPSWQHSSTCRILIWTSGTRPLETDRTQSGRRAHSEDRCKLPQCINTSYRSPTETSTRAFIFRNKTRGYMTSPNAVTVHIMDVTSKMSIYFLKTDMCYSWGFNRSRYENSPRIRTYWSAIWDGTFGMSCTLELRAACKWKMAAHPLSNECYLCMASPVMWSGHAVNNAQCPWLMLL